VKVEATDLRDAIAGGIQSLLRRTIQLTGERGEDPRPEYLTTAAICFSLCDFAEAHAGCRGMRIRSEEMTSDVWGKGLVRSLMRKSSRKAKLRSKAKRRRGKRQRDSTRTGNVDITLFSGESFEHPFAVIENKGLLHFTRDGSLYAGSRAEVVKDLSRNAEFVLRLGSAAGVQYSAFTFYVRDKTSVIRTDAEAFKQRTTTRLIETVQALNLDANLRSNVLLRTFDDNLYESEEAARAPDDLGAPAHDMDPAWHLLYGIISIYRVGDEVVDEQRLFESDTSPEAVTVS